LVSELLSAHLYRSAKQNYTAVVTVTHLLNIDPTHNGMPRIKFTGMKLYQLNALFLSNIFIRTEINLKVTFLISQIRKIISHFITMKSLTQSFVRDNFVFTHQKRKRSVKVDYTLLHYIVC
jgi:hypothetical protein